MPSFSSHQGTLHLRISYVHNKKKEPEIYKVEVPDTKKTNAEANGSGVGGGGVGGMGHCVGCDDGVVINVNPDRTITGDIKVEYYAKQHVIGKKKLFSFWFNTYFVCEKRDDGAYNECLNDCFCFLSSVRTRATFRAPLKE